MYYIHLFKKQFPDCRGLTPFVFVCPMNIKYSLQTNPGLELTLRKCLWKW